jgi:hypothetical protein
LKLTTGKKDERTKQEKNPAPLFDLLCPCCCSIAVAVDAAQAAASTKPAVSSSGRTFAAIRRKRKTEKEWKRRSCSGMKRMKKEDENGSSPARAGKKQIRNRKK